MTLVFNDNDESSALTGASGVLVANHFPTYGGVKDGGPHATQGPNHVVIKVIGYHEETGNKVIRRFLLPQICDDEEPCTPSFVKLMDLLQQGPIPLDKDGSDILYYKDSDGDVVAIATTMELTEAVVQMPGSKTALVLHLTPPPRLTVAAAKACSFLLFVLQQGWSCLGFTGHRLVDCASMVGQKLQAENNSTKRSTIMMAIFLPVFVMVLYGFAYFVASKEG